MAKKKKRAASAAGAKKKKPAEQAPETPAKKLPRDWAEIGRAYGLLLLSAVLMFLGFAGFGVWPLAFCGMVPALFVFDADPKPIGWKFFWRALFFGYIAYYGGFYWVVNTIVDFGGFPYPLALAFASIYFLYQAIEFVFVLWLWRRARERGFNATASLVAAYLTAETVFPMLFDHYYGNSFHMLPVVVQVADLGGPMLLTALAMLGNGAIYELARARIKKAPLPWRTPAVFAGAVLFVLGYGAWRIGEVEARVAAAPKIQVGVVQTNMGIYEKREDPGEGLRRHLEQSAALEAEHDLDLLVWPESAATFRVPREVGTRVGPFFDNAAAWFRIESAGFPETPLIFGGLSVGHDEDGTSRYYNTAFITDDDGAIQAHVDKTYLLAFGEYIPFGEMFPILYEWSPNTGHFTPGDHVQPLPFRDYRITTLVCYEDILPKFTRRAVREANPHLLVNVTNDAWFGDTQEPYIHLALAKMRAVEHHRYLVRATNTGVSAIIDPTGRVIAEGPLFDRDSLHGEVAMMQGETLYEHLGDWPGWLALGATLYMVLVGRRNRPEQEPPPEEQVREERIRRKREEDDDPDPEEEDEEDA